MLLPKIHENIVLRVAGIVIMTAAAGYLLFALIVVAADFTFVEMAMVLPFATFFYILIKHYSFDMYGILFVVVPLTILTEFISSGSWLPVVLFPLVMIKALLCLKYFLNNRAKIRLIITHTNLLIRAPYYYHSPLTYGGELNFMHLKISLHDLRSVSVKDVSDPSLENIIDGPAKYKVVPNERISDSSNPYQYVFVLRNPNQNPQFIDLEHNYQRRILIEFDDAQNFLRALEQTDDGKRRINIVPK